MTATAAVRETVARGLRLEAVLSSYLQINWHEPSLKKFATLPSASGKTTGLSCRALVLSNQPPLYFLKDAPPGPQSVAYEIRDEASGKTVLVAPDVGGMTSELRDALQRADAVFFDGTFWSNGELSAVRQTTRTALDMGHLPLQTHSLKLLREAPAKHKILLHINNTNPILRPGSPERAEVEAAGIAVGYDGLELEL